MQLSELKTGEVGVISKIRGRGAFRRRILEMGFVKGKEVKVIKNAPLKDPIEYSLLDYRVTLRKSEADLIIVVPDHSASASINSDHGSFEGLSESKVKLKDGNTINVAFVGNPNAGKTSLFNSISNSNEHTGNYSGVTVDSKTAYIEQNNYKYQLTDLPGTYSLSAYSPEELYVREYITDTIPDVVVNVVDVSNLERNLYLTCQLIDMDIKVILAFNMYDELERRKDHLDIELLGKLLGIPILPTVGSKGKGVDELLLKIASVFEDKEPFARHIHINYGQEIEKSIEKIQSLIKISDNFSITDRISSRFITIKLLEKDKHINNYIKKATNFEAIVNCAEKERKRLEAIFEEDILSLLTGKRYGFISGALLETYKKSQNQDFQATEMLDSFLTHKLFGFPFFIFFMWLMFTATFTLGKYPQNWLELGVEQIGMLISNYMPNGSFKDMLIDGVIGGVGGVLVFLPNILILFLFISFMEDSGYMARAVFIMDKLMHKIGLHGKSFIPLIMGFGCNVPAIMATRTIEDKNNRLLTMLINPFMSCSARLPVYLLLIGAIFPAYQGSLLFLLYFIGIFVAIGVAILFKKLIFKSESAPFVMELPPYRMPTIKSSVKHMWIKGSQYLKKMGGIILIASILLWALGYFPRDRINVEREDFVSEVLSDSNRVGLELASSSAEHTYIGRIGKFIEPVIRPLGFDWKMGVSLITGIAAKEVVVSTLGVLYAENTDTENGENRLANKISKDIHLSGPLKGKKTFNPLSTISFLIFILIYFPCIAVFAAVKKESGSAWWAVFMIFYTTFLAYALSFGVFQIGTLIQNL